ncbi:MAG TPA: hypothetical protein VG188_10810 [Solirubrobacteraceae bacterium]|jgi:hypothetical protein|nr:hypothetical protein [Solirubrobacteraceae bacterium]
MRRTTVLLLLVLAGTLLASCGKGSLTSTVVQRTSASTSPSSTTTGTTPAPGTTSPSPGTTPAPSHESAVAFARAVNLTSDDVPGFTPSEKHSSSSAHQKRLERAMLRCAGIGAGTGDIAGTGKGVLEESSKDFELKRQILDFSVSSEVSVQASAAQALRGLKAIRSPHVRGCFSHYLSLIFKEEQVKGAKAGPVTIQAGTPPAPGTSGGFGWRVTATFNVRGLKLPVYLDFLGFVDGPAEVTLTSSGLLRPFPASVQQHLFALLLGRAKAHEL